MSSGPVVLMPVAQLLLLALAAAPPPIYIDPETLPIDSASELRDYCQTRTEALLTGTGRTPHNFVASYIEDGNGFRVEGHWSVDFQEVPVTCRATRGMQRRYVTIDL